MGGEHPRHDEGSAYHQSGKPVCTDQIELIFQQQE